MPAIKEVLESLDEIRELHEKKNNDYENDGNQYFNFDVQEYIMNLFQNPRDKVYACLVGLKIARLASQLNKEFNYPSHTPNNESTLDSYNDSAAYTLIWKSDYQRRTGKTNKVKKAKTK